MSIEARARLVQRGAEAFLEGESGRSEISCFDLASDLAGALRGPSDLSSNRLLLRCYGR